MVIDAGARAMRLALTPAGAREVVDDRDEDRRADLAIVRSAAMHLEDVAGAAPAADVAAATRLEVLGERHLLPWGLPAECPLDPVVEEPVTMRLRCLDSPFAGRPLSIDLVVDHASLRTDVAAEGAADVEVTAAWDAACRWMLVPELLYADVLSRSLGLRGDLAVLSLFEGALWEITRARPSVGDTVLRWGRLWASPSVRRDVSRALATWAPTSSDGSRG